MFIVLTMKSTIFYSLRWIVLSIQQCQHQPKLIHELIIKKRIETVKWTYSTDFANHTNLSTEVCLVGCRTVWTIQHCGSFVQGLQI